MKIITEKALEIARTYNAPILVLTETGEAYETLKAQKPDLKVIVVTPNEETFQTLNRPGTFVLRLLTRRESVYSQIKDAIVLSLQKKLLRYEDKVVVLGSTLKDEATSIFFTTVKKEIGFTIYDIIKDSGIREDVLEEVIDIAIEIGKEGRGGRTIGTAFMIGDSKKVMKRSRQMILNPFEGYSIKERNITSLGIRETIKELAQLDGAFVITENGIIEAAGRYLEVDTKKVDIPRGLGARHAAVAAMTAASNALGITVSQSGGMVRIFKKGEMVMMIEPHRRISL
jgi:DNA integrity scanning protein DisA with diadenylate cyclase activity